MAKNPVAKNMNAFNRAATHTDRKKDLAPEIEGSLEDLRKDNLLKLVEDLGGLEAAEMRLNRLCILKWITPEILELKEAIKVYKEVYEL